MNDSQGMGSGQTRHGVEIMTWESIEEDREAWLKCRNSGIGASEVASLMGLSPWSGNSPADVWAVKTGKKQPWVGNDSTAWGSWLEDTIAAWYDKNCSADGTSMYHTGLWRSKKRQWQLASPDRYLVTADGEELVEIKTGGPKSAAHWSSGVPQYYYPQVQQQLDVVGLQICRVVASIAGAPPKVFTVNRDDKFIERMRAACEEFWWHVEIDTPPPLSIASSVEAICAANPIDPKTVVDLDFSGEMAWADYLQARSDESDARRRKETAAKELRLALGTAKRGLIDGKEVVSLAITSGVPRLSVKE